MSRLPQALPLPPSDFRCRRCGACCRERGTVGIDGDEADAIAVRLGIPTAAFLERYTVLRSDRRGRTLIEQPDGACVMLSAANRCRIQTCKPRQCRGFPLEWRNSGYDRLCAGMNDGRDDNGSHYVEAT